MMIHQTVSIVIPAYNGQKFLDENLPAVSELGVNEIIIIDDGSVQALDVKNVKLVRHLKNQGFPISVNDGFKEAKGDIVILLNQDVKPDKDLLKYTLFHFSDPKVFAVTFNENQRSWAKAEIKDGFLEFINGPLDNKIHSSFWASGGGSAFRKTYWDELGGFDPIFSPGYFEDLDISWRARNRGYEIIWEPKAKITHAIPESTFNKTFAKTKLQHIKDRNYLLAHWKNLDQKYLTSHFHHLASRVCRHPGYIIPVLWALWKKLA